MSIGDDIVAAIATLSAGDKMLPVKVWDKIAPVLASNYPVERVYLTGDQGHRVFHDVVAYNNYSYPATGTIKITLPFSWLSTMIHMVVRVHLYNNNDGIAYPIEIHLAGYAYATTSAWVATAARILGIMPNGPLTQIRFAHDGTKCCILLGSTSSNWYHFTLHVEEVKVSFYGVDDGWGINWGISLITSESGITVHTTHAAAALAAGYAFYAP